MSKTIDLPREWGCDGRELKPRIGANSNNMYDMGDLPVLAVAGKLVLRLY